MNVRTAKIISVLFHPLLMPTYLGGLLIFLVPSAVGFERLTLEAKLILWGLLFVYTFLTPLCIIYWLHRSGIVQNLEMTDLQDRRIPFVIITIFYGCITYFLYHKGSLFSPLVNVLFGITLTIGVIASISFFWQISAHGAGIGGILGFLISLYAKSGDGTTFYCTLFAIFVVGLIGSARLRLNAHTPTQIWVGVFLGLCLSLITMYYC